MNSKYVQFCLFQWTGIFNVKNIVVQDGALKKQDAAKIMNIALVPTVVGAGVGVAGALAFGFGSSLAFGAAYAGYQLTNRICDLVYTVSNPSCTNQKKHHVLKNRLNVCYKTARVISALVGVGIAAALIATTALPMLASVAIGCLAMQVLDYVINAGFTKLFDKYAAIGINWRPFGNGASNAASLGAFVAGAAVATAVSSVCPLPMVGEAAGVATTVGIEAAAGGISALATYAVGYAGRARAHYEKVV